MCACGTPTINGERGYKWQPNDTPSIRPVNPPALSETQTLVRDEPGRCGGLDSHCHHYRIVKSGGGYSLLVRHGGGDERLPLFKPEVDVMASLNSTPCYWIMNAIAHAHRDGANSARTEANQTWRKAAADKRIKTRKQRGSDTVKVWIEHADVTDMRAAGVLDRG